MSAIYLFVHKIHSMSAIYALFHKMHVTNATNITVYLLSSYQLNPLRKNLNRQEPIIQ